MSQGPPMDSQQPPMYAQVPQYNPNPSPQPQQQIINPNMVYAQPQPQPMYGYAPMQTEGGPSAMNQGYPQQQYSPQPYQQPYQQYPMQTGQQPMMMQPIMMQQQPMQTQNGGNNQQMMIVTSSSSPQAPIMYGNPYQRELLGQRCCCSCCDIRTGVMVLSLFLVLSGIIALASINGSSYVGSYSWSSWLSMFGDLFCGCAGFYGAYNYNWRWTYALLIWLYIVCIIYLIVIIIYFAVMSSYCDTLCNDDYTYYSYDEDVCYSACVSVFTSLAVYYIFILILQIYFAYVVNTFVHLLKQAEAKMATQGNGQGQQQTTVAIATVR